MVACAACGSAAAPGQRFCGDCGASLGAAEAPAAAAREERKVVTAVFVDLVGSTAWSEDRDVEDVRHLLERYHAAVRSVLERFGGSVEKFIGDAVAAVFGAPVAHEDDAERAVRGALESVAAVLELGVGLHVRVGVATGEALVDLSAVASNVRGMASGDVLNTAARLQAAAPVDGVLVADATQRATRREIVYEATAAIAAKGKAQPVECWNAVRPRSRQPEQMREHHPLVGRARESQALVDAFERCRRAREVRLLTIVGVPGIGKSRLVDELGASVDAEAELVVWRHGRVLPYGDGGGLWALEQIVKQECGVFDSDPRATMLDKIADTVAALGTDGPDARFVCRQVGVLLGLDADPGLASRRDALAGWRMFVAAMARQTPTVIVFDDAHWADGGLLDVIEDLASRIVGVPLLIVATARPELLTTRPDWAGGVERSTLIELEPLAAIDVATIVNDRLGDAALAGDVERRLVERANGNPLFALEYARSLAEGSGDNAVPDSLQSLIAARVDRLDADQKWFLQRAAMLGDTAWLEAVCALGDSQRDQTGDQARDHAETLLDALEHQQFLRRSRSSSIEGAVEFEFLHALVRDVAYRQLPRGRRREGHERAGVWLGGAAADPGRLSEQIAHHFTVALDLARDLHEPDAELRVAATEALVGATGQATARHDHDAAIRYSDRALDLDPSPSQRATLLVARELASHANGQGDHEALLAALDEALDTGHHSDAIAVLFALSDVAEFRLGDAALGETYAERAATLAADQPPGPVTTLGPYAYAFALNARGCFRESIELCDREITRADAYGATEAAALLRVQRGRARCIIGDPGGAAESAAAARVLLEHRHPRAATAALSSTSNLYLAGDIPAGRQLLVDAIAWARQNAPASNDLLFVLALAAREMAMFDRDAEVAVEGAWREIGALAAALGELDHDTGWIVASAELWYRQLVGEHPDVGVTVGAASEAHGAAAPYARLSFLAGAAFVAAMQRDPVAGPVCDAYLETYFAADWDHGVDQDAAQVAVALAAIGRRSDIERITALVPIRGLWLLVLEALASGRDDDAAACLTEMRCDGLAQRLGSVLHGATLR